MQVTPNAPEEPPCIISHKNLLQNRIILVTGASDGIGREAALTYSEYGASLILLGRNEEKLKAVAREIETPAVTPRHGIRSIC